MGFNALKSGAFGQPRKQTPTRINGPDDPIANAIGRAEGNTSCEGKPTRAYFGHKDPGNNASNLGKFSAQGGLNKGTPAASDLAVVGTLNWYIKQYKFDGYPDNPSNSTGGPNPDEEAFRAWVNHLDLVVQAPATVPDYIKRIKRGESILNARVGGFLRADGSVDALGFDHNLIALRDDQARRMAQIDSCFKNPPGGK